MSDCRAPKEQRRTPDRDEPRRKVAAMCNDRRYSESQARGSHFVLEGTVRPANERRTGLGEHRMYHEVVEVHEANGIKDVIREQFVSDRRFRHRSRPAK